MKRVHITVPWDPYQTSENRIGRWHWAPKSELCAQAKAASRQAWREAGEPRAAGKVRATVIVRRGRVMDQANVWSGLKHVIDGLFVGAITPDDGPRWLELGGVVQETGKECRGHEAVEFVIEEL